MRLAFFSPFQPQQSGISDYSEELLPYLAHYAEIDLFFDGDQPTNQRLTKQFAIHPISDFPTLYRMRYYDTCLYQMGNSVYHAAIYATLRQYPGVTVLHEHMLHHFFFATTAAKKDWAAYWRELAYNAEPEFINQLPPRTWAFSPALPLTRRVIDLSLGVIVHNQEMARRVKADNPQARVVIAPMGLPLPAQHAEQQMTLRRKLGLPPQAFIVGSFGHLNRAKRIEVVLRAFARLRQQCPEAIYLIVGRTTGVETETGEYNLPALLNEMGLDSQAVIITGFVPQETLGDYIQATDVCVNLRYPVYGETSAAALRLMAYGKPLIVSDVATFDDLPDEACVRIGVNAAETELLYHSLLLLAQQPELRRLLGNNARRYIKEQHTLSYAARKMAAAIRDILAAAEEGN